MTQKRPPSPEELIIREYQLATARSRRAAQARAATDLLRLRDEAATAYLKFKITRSRYLSAGSSGMLYERARFDYQTELGQLRVLAAELSFKMQDPAVFAEARARLAKAAQKRLEAEAECPPPVKAIPIP